MKAPPLLDGHDHHWDFQSTLCLVGWQLEPPRLDRHNDRRWLNPPRQLQHQVGTLSVVDYQQVWAKNVKPNATYPDFEHSMAFASEAESFEKLMAEVHPKGGVLLDARASRTDLRVPLPMVSLGAGGALNFPWEGSHSTSVPSESYDYAIALRGTTPAHLGVDPRRLMDLDGPGKRNK